MRYENWKIVFEEQRAPGTMRIWAEAFTKLRVPKIFLGQIPMRADITSNTYYDWLMSDGVGCIHWCPTDCRKVSNELLGISTKSTTIELQHRPNLGKDAAQLRGGPK